MTQDTQKTVNRLNDLLALCYDGVHGYHQAAEHVESASLKRELTQNQLERQRLADQLQAEIRRLGGQPTDDGTWAGQFHRGWINFREALSGNSDEAILKECWNGDDYAQGEYENFLKEDHPTQVIDLVLNQYNSVKENLSRTRQLAKQEEWANA